MSNPETTQVTSRKWLGPIVGLIFALTILSGAAVATAQSSDGNESHAEDNDSGETHGEGEDGDSGHNED